MIVYGSSANELAILKNRHASAGKLCTFFLLGNGLKSHQVSDVRLSPDFNTSTMRVFGIHIGDRLVRMACSRGINQGGLA